MTQGFPPLGFLQAAEKSIVFCRHLNVENQVSKCVSIKTGKQIPTQFHASQIKPQNIVIPQPINKVHIFHIIPSVPY